MNGLKMNRIVLFFVPALLLFSFSLHAQEPSKSMSWVASGSATTNFSIEDSGFNFTLDGTHQEINFLQSRSPFTNLFIGWHFINLDYTGEGTDSSGSLHAVDYQSQLLALSLGYDWYLAGFAHLQPYFAYGYGTSTYSATNTASDSTVTPYEEKSETADMGIYGFNLILELTGKLWLGYALNYFSESQVIKYDNGDATLEPQTSQTLMLVWNWEAAPIGTIDPRKNIFGF